MPSRPRVLLLVLGLVLALVAGCTGDGGEPRSPGDEVTQDEAQVLAQLLHKNFEAGGADFVLSAPYGEGALLTLTGEIDFRRSVGHARAVTTFEDDREDDVRTIFFTPKDIWFGDVPGLAEALAGAGAPQADYVRRPLITTAAGGTASLVDVLVQLVMNLSARNADDPRAFRNAQYTWQGQASIDGQLASLFRLRGGATVAVAASDEKLVQYVTTLPKQEFEVTITLADHGERNVEVPAEDQTVLAEDYPEVAAAVGV